MRLDFAFNGGGSALLTGARRRRDERSAGRVAIQGNKAAFGFINHTFEHPNLDCSTAPFITKQVNDNVAWADAHGIPIDASEVVTGEHSGLANSRPGNPGTIDPPSIDDAEPGDTPARFGGVPAGTYDYALTARSAAGESTASIVPGVAVATAGVSVVVSFNAVCHAVSYKLYRRTATSGALEQVGTLTRPGTAATDDGTAPLTLTITDDQAAGTAGAPPAANGAALAPYAQNPNYLAGLLAAGVGFVATDASKTYPSTRPTSRGANGRPGATFTEGTPPSSVQAVPRYPSNVYYNVSRQGQQLDEYNWIYVAPANGGGCVPIAGCHHLPHHAGDVDASTSRARTPSCSATSWATTRGRTSCTRATWPTTTRRCPRPTPTRAASSTRSSTGCWAATTRRSTARTTPLVQLTSAQVARDARPAGRVGGAPRRRRGHGVAAGRQAARQEHERARRSTCR